MRATLSILLLFFVFNLCAQSRTHRTVTVVKAGNGVIKSRTVTKVTTNFYVDLFNYYKKTTVRTMMFDSITGKKVSYTKRITRNGMGGHHCYEMYCHVILFDTKGKKTRDEETWCDKGARKLREYEHGKCVFETVERKRRKKIQDE
ncbi:MAG TPA: hypothetical protein VL651_05125 [Bacteroidia bacterium]|jgi:hypothetical protein|nr:hypothetical protein [Bacteroidia bacterium]